jgi:hypothetical protein
MSRINLDDSRLHKARLISSSHDSVVYLLTGDYIISDEGPSLLFLDPGVSSRTVFLPPIRPAAGQLLLIANRGVQNLNVVDDDGVPVITVSAGKSAFFISYLNGWTHVTQSIGPGTGDVNGPALSFDNAVARYDQFTGKFIQNSDVIIDDGGALRPRTMGLAPLGLPTEGWSHLFLSAGAEINWMTPGPAFGATFRHLTPSNGMLLQIDPLNALPDTVFLVSVDGGVELTLTAGDLSPGVDGGLSLGNTLFGWQSLHGNTGFALSIENGDWFALHTPGVLNIATGDIRINNPGSNGASVVTVGGVQTITNKVFVDPVVPLTAGANVALDAALGNLFYLANNTGPSLIAVPSNRPSSGFSQKLTIRHEAIGADRTLSLTTGTPGAFRFGTFVAGLTPTLNGTVDYIGAIYNHIDDRWDVVSYSKGF